MFRCTLFWSVSPVVRKVRVEKAPKAEVKAICARTIASTWTENRTVNTLQSGRGEVKFSNKLCVNDLVFEIIFDL